MPHTKHYQWDEVQAHYDLGHSQRQTMAHFGMNRLAWAKAIKRGDLVVRPRDAHFIPLEELLVVGRNTSRQHLKQRLFRLGLLENKCQECGIGPEWNGKALPLELDHINGINNDNRIENLRILCPNCHAQTDTNGGKNKKTFGSPIIGNRPRSERGIL